MLYENITGINNSDEVIRLERLMLESWTEFKILLEGKSAEELLQSTIAMSLLIQFQDAVHEFVISKFQNKIIAHLVMHDLNNSVNNLSIYLDEELTPAKQKAPKISAIEMEKLKILNYTPALFEFINQAEMSAFSLYGILVLLSLSSQLVTGIDVCKVNFQFEHSLIIIALAIHELENNARKNGSRSESLEFSITVSEGKVTVACKDHGKGMNQMRLSRVRKSLNAMSSTASVSANSGFGLKAMKYFGIGVLIDSEGKRKGTTVSLSFPVSAGEG